MNFVKKILLVHGDANSRRTLTLLLAGAGYDVRPCGQPEVALEAARSEWFDLSLVADPLPEMSSFGLIEELKKQYELVKIEEIKNIPIINVMDPATAAARKDKPKRAMNER